jgi:arginyl-tRNA--protein-N-Asp/Glu arginylyltransferase
MDFSQMTHDAPFRELEIEGSPSPCSYLPGQTKTMIYRVTDELSETRYEELLSRGWRRFGRTLFRPACSACSECCSLRVSLPQFKPNKNQRRSLSRNAHLTLTVQYPTVTEEHIQLYNLYHQDMHRRRQWPFRTITEDDYCESFLEGCLLFAREFQYRDGGRLVGLGLVDVTPSAMSSVYFFHDPEYRNDGLGTFSIQKEIEFGRQHNRQWLYMGYYIRECESMNYKNRFRPHQILKQYVADEEQPVWEIPEEIPHLSPDQSSGRKP